MAGRRAQGRGRGSSGRRRWRWRGRARKRVGGGGNGEADGDGDGDAGRRAARFANGRGGKYYQGAKRALPPWHLRVHINGRIWQFGKNPHPQSTTPCYVLRLSHAPFACSLSPTHPPLRSAPPPLPSTPLPSGCRRQVGERGGGRKRAGVNSETCNNQQSAKRHAHTSIHFLSGQPCREQKLQEPRMPPETMTMSEQKKGPDEGREQLRRNLRRSGGMDVR